MKEQYKDIVNSVVNFSTPKLPREGWVRSIRTALGMSGAQLANRLGLSRNQVSVLERREIEGKISINQLKNFANALDCELAYVLIPKQDVDSTIKEQAELVAKKTLTANYQSMFLEAQSIDPKKQAFLIEQLSQELINSGGRKLWNNKPSKS